MEIRKYVADTSDDAALAILHARVNMTAPHLDGAQFREHIQRIKKSTFNQIWMVEEAGQLVAYLCMTTPWWGSNDQIMLVFLDVDPSHRRRGIATMLLGLVRQELAEHPCSEVSIKIDDTDQDSIQFAKNRGLQSVMSFVISEFNLCRELDSALHQHLSCILESGIQLVDGQEIIRRYPRDWKHRWWKLHDKVVNDVPSVDTWEGQSFEEFADMNLRASRCNPSNWQFAVYQDELIAFSGVSIFNGNPTVAYVELTGVLVGHRRQGIARALKVKSILSAQSMGLRYIRTENEVDNPMLLLNKSLGFRMLHGISLYRGSINS